MSNLKINMNDPANVKQSLESRTLKVCVIGIGRIGLPTALSFAKSGLETIGVDINETLVNNINSGIFPLKDEPGYEEIFHEVLESKKFLTTTKIEDAVPQSDLILNLEKDELIHTENSQKFTISNIKHMSEKTGFEIKDVWYDEKQYFAMILLSKND